MNTGLKKLVSWTKIICTTLYIAHFITWCNNKI